MSSFKVILTFLSQLLILFKFSYFIALLDDGMFYVCSFLFSKRYK